VTDFPFAGDKPFRSTALEAMASVYNVQVNSSELGDASFYPTLSVELGYSKKDFTGAPDAQKFAALRARWDILDGGSRSAMRGRNTQMAYDLLAQARDLEVRLRASFETLKTRRDALLRASNAAEFGQKAAAAAQQQALQSYSAGLAKSVDVRAADEAKLRADFALLQLKFALQGLAVESLALTGNWNELMRGRYQR
jgi:outer membrane protein TolC